MYKIPKAHLKPVLLLEFIVLFVAIPILFYFLRHDIAPYLLLCLVTFLVWCLMSLITDPRFKRFRLWNLEKLNEFLPSVLKTFAVAAISITFLSWWLTPQWLFSLPQNETLMWLALLILYPLLSAWPQEIIFRTYLFHRYKKVFRSKNLRAWLSAFCFALAHLMFANWIAVLGSFIAGLVFAYTYLHSRSTLLVALEHSLWGCWLFTAGLGIHFDSGMLA